ncbi:hypothetical protein HMPREF9446_01317 [Bacteroides fluxus YIT 12057]|uniref:Uncharacterized protein n=1 Tax=Bacteroides fluxus YIT 12057 TaxID=763034 RepID=F3PRG7_9BACE|nr:hypothetical protein HMPREF9446_01317 [Bacteroides fluxus YIT 12057]
MKACTSPDYFYYFLPETLVVLKRIYTFAVYYYTNTRKQYNL